MTELYNSCVALNIILVELEKYLKLPKMSLKKLDEFILLIETMSYDLSVRNRQFRSVSVLMYLGSVYDMLHALYKIRAQQ